MAPVGIHGVGIYLPEQVRGNDWWPATLVEQWREKKKGHTVPSQSSWVERQGDGPELPPLPGISRVIEALTALKDDPFQGSRERRVAPDDVVASQLEVRAARDAIARAGIDANEIGFLLSYSAVPDYLLTPNACAVHKQLGLPERCLSLAVEGACNSFALQLNLAEKLISSGQYRYGLLVGSSLGSRVVPSQQPGSALFGDGAVAVVVGPVADGYGVLGRSHHTDGTSHRGVVIGVPGKRWHDEGRNVFYVEDAELGRGLILTVADHAKECLEEALADAGMTKADVDFYACHQGTAWIRQITQEFAELGRARSVDTFAWAGSLMGANLPLVFAVAEREGMLRDGDVVTTFSGGLGETWSSLVLRWGKG
ncbi:MAG TPA: 3-oxoacyl-[acyl-carrier-protein] synthase III C-terminal domain-containing protein [Kofleriaceae bacterium]